MMKFLLHSWLRIDGICSVYVYILCHMLQQISLDPSENATFRPLITSGGEFEVAPNEVAMQVH